MIITRYNLDVNIRKLHKELKDVFNDTFLGFNGVIGKDNNGDNLRKFDFHFVAQPNEETLDNILSNHTSAPYTNFVYNNKTYIEKDKNFKQNFLYQLTSKVENSDIDAKGDVLKLKWYKDENLAIEEDRVYTRTKEGVFPAEVNTLTKQTNIKFYREEGDYEEIVLNRVYNEKDRKERDKKSRTLLLEQVRYDTGIYIAQETQNNSLPTDTPEIIQENINNAIAEAKLMFDVLNKEISQYRNDRIKEPLINGLNNFPRTSVITNDVINFILSKVDIEFYTVINS